MSQSVKFAAGTYVLSFKSAQRGNVTKGGQDFEVFIDRMRIGRFRPAQVNYLDYATNPFGVTAGTHTIRFSGLNTSGGDNTVFIDQVGILAKPRR